MDEKKVIILDNLSVIKDKIAISLEEHNLDPTAHPDIRIKLNELKGRIIALELAVGNDIVNPFVVTFGNLDGITADGVWKPAEGKLEF